MSKPLAPILIAVSGGSDSLALLHQLAETQPKHTFHVATVDHQLRPESAAEAEHVAKILTALGLPHKILLWENNNQSSSAAARKARYSLLVAHAKTIGANKIALGHTLDDQAETLLMRAKRMTNSSGTRGLSGMNEYTTFESITLHRPLLHTSRETLREYLRQRNIRWIDDPSNEKLSSERIRTRRSLSNNPHLPFPKAIARLASFSGRHRHWMNRQTAALIHQFVTNNDGQLVQKAPRDTPTPILIDLFATLILVSGGQPFRPPVEKLHGLVSRFQSGQKTRQTIGRCLVSIEPTCVKFTREQRNLAPLPAPSDNPQIYDNRLLIHPNGTKTPFITTLERFRPSTDDCVHKAVMNVLSSPY